MLQYGVSGTVVRNYVNSNKFLQGSTIDKEKLLNEKYAAPKREEIQNLCSKYSLNEMVMKRLAKESIMNDDLECGTITKTTDYLANILKIIFDYSDEEVSNFLNKNSLIMIASYGDFRTRLTIFNNIGLLSDIIFKGASYLGHDFTNFHFGTRSLYAVIMKRNITSLDELREAVLNTSEKDLPKLREEFPLTSEQIQELDKKLQRKIAFRKEMRERKLNKSIK